MAVSRITREQMINQSIQDLVQEGMRARGYPIQQVEFLDSYDEDNFNGPLDKDYIASGYFRDDGGRDLELGSQLRERVYIVEFYVVARTANSSLNLANAIRDVVEEARVVPLKDLRLPGTPVMDYLQQDAIRVEKKFTESARPWEQNVWIVTIPLVDEFYPTD